MKKIAIIGAGISGLFIANLFKENLDYQVAIYEKNTSINLDEGYGIQLSTNSIKLLNTIGFNSLESKDRFNPEKIDFYETKHEKKICDLNISEFNSENCKYTTLKRSKLVEFLNFSSSQKKKPYIETSNALDKCNMASLILSNVSLEVAFVIDCFNCKVNTAVYMLPSLPV